LNLTSLLGRAIEPHLMAIFVSILNLSQISLDRILYILKEI